MIRKITLFMILIVGSIGCNSQKELVPMDLSELTIADIHEAYIAKRFTAEELTMAYLKRITEFDGRINSITTINPEAISIAKQLDIEYQKTGKLRPLHGIPVIVKDNINTKGLPTTAGALALKDFSPNQDATIITKLQNAGVMGVFTNAY
jgi:amidase